jgi:hypothetical protein
MVGAPAMESSEKLKEQYPWIQTPLVVSAPMRLITLAESAVEVSKAGMRITYIHSYARSSILRGLFSSLAYSFEPFLYPFGIVHVHIVELYHQFRIRKEDSTGRLDRLFDLV